MTKFRKKQKALYSIMKFFIIFGAVFLFVYIGVKPYVADFNTTLATVFAYFCDALVIIVMILVFMYYSKYGKIDSFLTSVENEINDYGYYISSRLESTAEEYIDIVKNDIKNSGYSINTDYSLGDFDVDFKAVKRKEFFYMVSIGDLDKNDVVAYIDSVINDIVVNNLKRKGNAVICFVTDKAQESAIELSKMITPVGKKGQLKVGVAIVEPTTKNTYFLGNVQSKCSKMIANFVMNCDLPIKETYIHKDKLPYQHKLAEKMEGFSLTDYNSGKFYIH
ncbi:MAG: hypothetical protein J1E81_06370 [Eubacterium sp.]|nr:hypothetical protein [Eubacterium sp.]